MVLYSDTAYSIRVTERRIADPKGRKVPGVGVAAAWSENPPERIYELNVRTASGAVTILLDPDSKLRTDDLAEIAVAVFRYAEPRLP